MPLKLTKTATPSAVDQLITVKEAAQILSISVSTLHNDRWVAKKEGVLPKVPFVRLPTGGIRYRASDLQYLITSSVVG